MERVHPKPALRRKSVFVEVGLTDEETVRRERSPAPSLILGGASGKTSPRPVRTVRFRSSDSVFEHENDYDNLSEDEEDSSDYESDDDGSLATMQLLQGKPRYSYQRAYRMGVLALMLALLLPVLQTAPMNGLGVRGGAIPRSFIDSSENSALAKREDTPTEICKRWSHQSMYPNLFVSQCLMNS